MEVNETITKVELRFSYLWSREELQDEDEDEDEDEDQLSEEGLQAQWPSGKFFQSALVESDIPLCQVSSMCEKQQEATTGAEAPDSVVLVSSHPEKHQDLPTFFLRQRL